MTSIIEGKYEFVKNDREIRGLIHYELTIYNNNAKKAWNRFYKAFYFTSDQNRTNYINNFISNIRSHAQAKLDRAKARKEMINPAKVGDILSASWGHDQTNVDFYQVLEVKNKSVTIQEIGLQPTDRDTANSMADYVIPRPGAFLKTKPITRVVKCYSQDKDQYCVNINQVASASKWDGRPEYRSWYA
ncbi:MAG: hypothetical protein KCHDKBKB_00680 [Elusimicrobia bacterium]|nr:hypothetical protein [Elusimicrobiota bacterium]